jgi:hypothetical protein
LRGTSVAGRGNALLLRGDSDGRDEAVSATRQGFNEPGTVGGIAERCPQLRDGDVEAPLEVDESLAPQSSPQFVTRHELARTLDEYREEVKWFALQFDLDALSPQLAGTEIDLKGSELDDISGALGFPHQSRPLGEAR